MSQGCSGCSEHWVTLIPLNTDTRMSEHCLCCLRSCADAGERWDRKSWAGVTSWLSIPLQSPWWGLNTQLFRCCVSPGQNVSWQGPLPGTSISEESVVHESHRGQSLHTSLDGSTEQASSLHPYKAFTCQIHLCPLPHRPGSICLKQLWLSCPQMQPGLWFLLFETVFMQHTCC